MDYYIINKIEVDGSGYMTNVYGYTTSTVDADAINEHYNSCLGAWITENETVLREGTVEVSTYFDSNPACYNAEYLTTDISGYGEIAEITDISNLI
jgi:hypothetical protein